MERRSREAWVLFLKNLFQNKGVAWRKWQMKWDLIALLFEWGKGKKGKRKEPQSAI